MEDNFYIQKCIKDPFEMQNRPIDFDVISQEVHIYSFSFHNVINLK